MKTKILFGIFFFCGVLTWGLGVSADTIFTDDFNLYHEGILDGQGDWSDPSGAFMVQSQNIVEGTKAMGVERSGLGFMAKKTGTIRNDGMQTIYVKRSGTLGKGQLLLYEGGAIRVIISLNNALTGTFSYANLAGWHDFGAFDADTWYAIQIQWRSSDHKVRYNLNGGTWTEYDEAGSPWVSGLDGIAIQELSQRNGDGLYFDAIGENLVSNKNPVLIVPGITGTDLIQGSNLLWADLPKMILSADDDFMDALQFDENLTPLNSDLILGEIFSKKTVNLIAGELSVFDYTFGLRQDLISQGYTEGGNLFTFPYDWRYGVSAKYANGKTNSDLLKEKITEILMQTGAREVDIIAHSMGGLIAKKYVIENSAAHHIGKVVFVGVPNTGAPKAVKALIQGDNLNISGLNDQEIKKLAANMPAMYDLLPSQKYYDVKGSFVKVVDNGSLGVGPVTIKELNYGEVKSFLTDDHGLNAAAMAGAEVLHTQAFDDFDMRAAGVDVYAVDGCTTPTITNIVESRAINIFGQKLVDYKALKWGPGDKTVPLESSTNLPINQENKFYSLNASHGTMMTQDGSRQQIVNIVAGSSLAVDGGVITQDISECKLNGKAISVFSPVDIFVTDAQGNEMGLAADGSIFNEIANADFQIWGEHKFLYLPTDGGQTYTISMDGTGVGTYTIKTDDIENNEVVKTQVFSNLPVTADLTGTVNLGTAGAQDSLTVKKTVTSQPEVIFPDPPDTVAPEAIIEFDPVAKDLKFSAQESGIVIVDKDNVITLTDEAGNVTEITLKERGRKKKMAAEIKSLKYNGVAADISKNVMKYSWLLDSSGQVKALIQHVRSNKDYNVAAIFNGKATQFKGKDAGGKIKKSFSGLKIIKITTNKGNFEWSY